MANSGSNDPIPLVSALSDVYSAPRLTREGQRWDRLAKEFTARFGAGVGGGSSSTTGAAPHFIARAPGRVNIIGEHIDHMGFSCLPAALEMDILMAVRVHTDPEGKSKRVEFDLQNTEKRFEATKFESSVQNTDEVQLVHEGGSRWANYFKVAFKGLHPHLPPAVLSGATTPTKIEVLIDGTIPPESSLSSSAAMTSCSSIVILEAFQARNLISRREMAEVAIESERLVGVASGGMDQAASIFGVPGHALHISFVPTLTVQPTKLPASDPAHAFVVANTLVVSDKKVMGPVQYNLRVAELWMACRALCVHLNLPKDDSTKTLKKLMETYFAKHPLQGDQEQQVREKYGEEAAKIKVLGALAGEILPKKGLTRDEVEQLTGFKGDAFDKEFLSQFPVRAETFKLYSRTKHVFAEAFRVLVFKSLCTSSSSADVYTQLGSLLDDSQTSLLQDYENGCQELEEVVSIAKKAGALGSRATGAGWGGSTVSLVREDKVKDVLEALKVGYYKKRFPQMSDEQLDEALLVSQPAGGACVYKVD